MFVRRCLLTASWVPVVMLLVACHPAPRHAPAKMGPVDTGPGSLEFVRRQLMGTWDLVKFETMSAQGQATEVKASGMLTYDEFGNLTMYGKAEAPTGPLALDINGRAVIDVTKHQLKILSVTGNTQVTEMQEVSLDRVRTYSFDGPLLRLATMDAAGHVSATSVWKKRG